MLLRYREKGVLGADHLPFYWGCLKIFKGNILSNTLSKHYFKHLLFYIACQKKFLRLLTQWNTYEQCFIMYKRTRILIVLHKQFMPPPPSGRFPGRFGCQKDHLQFFDNNPWKDDPNIIIFIVEEELTHWILNRITILKNDVTEVT